MSKYTRLIINKNRRVERTSRSKNNRPRNQRRIKNDIQFFTTSMEWLNLSTYNSTTKWNILLYSKIWR